MGSVAYRSFLVRAWEHGGVPVRVLIEEVQSGRRSEVRGTEARRVVEALAIAPAASAGGIRESSEVPAEASMDRDGNGGNGMVLVVGATGMVGTEICRLLVAQGMQVRGLVRQQSSHEKVEALRGLGVETVVGDLRDAASLEVACANEKAVVTTVSSMPFAYEAGVNDIATTDLEGTKRLIDAARTAGVDRFVYTSFSKNIDLDMPLGNAKRAVEDHLMASGLTYTILRPSYFMEVWLSPAVGFDAANAKATIYGDGTAPISWIALGDVARFAARSVTASRAANATLELGGPEAISPSAVVRIFERVGGRPFETQHVPEDALAAQAAAATDPMSRSFSTLMRCYARGDAIPMTDVLEGIPVRLTSVEAYAERVLGMVVAGAR